jgi:peptide/nickel transport system substrate-binding protein
MRFKTVIVPLACILIAAVTACTSSSTSTSSSGSASGTTGGTLTIGIGAYPTSLNPNQQRITPASTIYHAIFDTLVDADPSSGKLSAGLATSWKPIGTTDWQFSLRKGVKFSDGTPFTAKDVVATINLILHGTPASQYESRVDFVTGATAVNDYTVDIKTNGQGATLPTAMVDIFMYEASEISKGGNAAVNSNPIGTGQFKIQSKQEGVKVTLVRNPYYWGQAAKLSTVVFDAITDDATRAAALQQGAIDIAYNVPPDTAKTLNGQDGISIKSVAIGQGMMLQFALASPNLPANSPLRNPLVRQALSYAVNTQALVSGELLGYTSALNGQLIGPDGRGYDSKIANYAYNPTKAKQLLAQAGYPNGFALTIETSQGRYVKQQEIPQAIAGELAQVGVNATVNTLDWSDLNAAVAKGTVPVYYIGWNYYPVMDGDYPFQLFTCSSVYKLMCNTQFDQLLRQERSDSNEDQRIAILQQMEVILHNQAPGVFLFQSPDIFGVRSNVQGFTPTADDTIHLDTISMAG